MRFLFKSISVLSLTFLIGFVSTQNALAASYNLSGKISDSSGNAISGANVNVIDVNTSMTVATSTSDSSGNYNISIDSGTYNIQVTPPSGSSFSSAVATNKVVSGNTIVNFILVPAGSASLSGHVYDRLGNPVSNQRVALVAGSTTKQVLTDSAGNFALQASVGTYELDVDNGATPNVLTVNLPQNYGLRINNYSLPQSTVIDFTVPAKKIDLHIQDSTGNPVSNVEIKTTPGGFINGGNLYIGGGITNALGSAQYGSGVTGPKTDVSGNVTIWLLPNDSNRPYSITANPVTESGFLSTSLSNIEISGDTSFTMTLPQSITLSGHVFDSLGNPISNQKVLLVKGSSTTQVTTDSSGSYSIQASPNSYEFDVNGITNPFSVNAPQDYGLRVNNYSLTQNTTLDVTVPAKKITVHVQDGLGNPINNVELKTTPGGLINNGNLSIGGNINNAQGSSQYGASASGPKTDTSGNATLWLLPNDSNLPYTITAVPPSESGFQSTTLPNTVISQDEILNITLPQPVTLSGHVYDSLGNPVSGQRVALVTGSTTKQTVTDNGGNYSLEASTGTYELNIDNGATLNALSLNLPQSYSLRVASYTLSQNTSLDFTIPAKKITVHVQDQSGNPVNNVSLKTSPGGFLNIGELSISGNISNAWGSSQYGQSTSDPLPATDASGDTTLWLLPNDSNHNYTFTAIPPIGSIYNSFTLNNISFTEDQTELISLQYSHNPPTTTATLSPTPNPSGTYSNPTTITLSATAAPGYTIANTYYTIDGGSQQTYSSPFTISNSGNNTITYWSIDNSGVQETHNSKTFTITTPITPTPPQLTSLNPAKIWIGLKNSDDIGIKFDLKAEVYKNNTLITSGQINSISAGSSGFTHARLNTIPFNTFSPINFPSGSKLSLKIYARNACNGSGKNSGTARLWYNDPQANSKFTATIASNTSNYFLLNNSILGTSTGTGPKKTSDISAGKKCSPFKSFGTWTITL